MLMLDKLRKLMIEPSGAVSHGWFPSILLRFALQAVGAALLLASSASCHAGDTAFGEFVKFGESFRYQKTLKPIEHTKKKQKNQNSGRSFYEHVVKYQGAKIEYMESRDDLDGVVSLEVTETKSFNFPRSLKIGDSMSRVIAAMGSPSEREADYLKYRNELAGGIFSISIFFHFSSDKLAKVEWIYAMYD